MGNSLQIFYILNESTKRPVKENENVHIRCGVSIKGNIAG